MNQFLGKVNLPYLALPFNMIIVCTFMAIQPRDWDSETTDDVTTEMELETTTMMPEDLTNATASSIEPVRDE